MRRTTVAGISPIPEADVQPLTTSVRRGAFWSIAASLLLRLTSILVTAIVAHILDRKQFGVFTIALTAYTIVLAVGELGLASCLTRADFDLDSLAPTMVTVSLTTNALQALSLFVFATRIATILGSADAASSIRVMALTTIIAGVVAVPDCQLIRNFKQKKLFLAQACGSVPSIVVLLILAKLGFGAIAYAWSMAIGLFFSTCVVLASVPKFYFPGLTRSALSVLLRFGAPLGAANIINCILLNVDYALIGHLVGAIALGTYVVAFNVSSWPSSLLNSAVSWLAVPVFSRVKSDVDLLKNAVVKAVESISLVVMPISALTIATSHSLILTLYGAKWAPSASVLSILAIYGGISIICVLFANILTGLGLSKSLFFVQLFWLVSLFPAMLLGLHWKGLIGAAMAHVFVIFALIMPCYLAALRRMTGVSSIALAGAILPSVAASFAAALAAKTAELQFADPVLQLVIGLAVGGTTYLIVTAPLTIELLSRDQAIKSPIAQISNAYSRMAQFLGLLGYESARNSRRGDKLRIDKETQHMFEIKPMVASRELNSPPARSGDDEFYSEPFSF
ncbi:MAG TPA: oligosaccharide flippase family protein [Trebonia sp.]|nr:oligosaccharide flippase family protein [Trebonia sp.]